MIQTKNFPKVRFKEFNDKWSMYHLSEILNEHKIRNIDNYKEVFSVAKQKGVINQIEHLGRSFSADDISNYKVVLENDVIYTKSPTADFPFGIIKQNKTNRKGVVSVLYAVFTPLNKYVGKLLDYYFSSPTNTFNYLIPLVNKGAKNTMNISNTSFLNGEKINLPTDVNEQQKITEFLDTIDHQISKLSLIVNLLQKYKKGMMQKIFSQKIQFKDMKAKQYKSWEKMRFGEVFERIVTKNIGNNTNVLTISAQQGLVCQTDYFNKSVSSTNLTGYYLLKKNDFAYNKSYSADYPMGAIKKLNHYNEGVVSTLYICFRVKKGYSSEFFEQYFNAGLQNKEISMIAQEGARNHGLLNIGVNDFFDVVILNVPKIDEQQKIAECLLLQDDKINLAKKELEQAKMFKKGLLQQMFI
ncbi:restriction endonuclease subunit S [Candidatus Dojkabacteria bacterium]|nr:restriction endonuclease subunit S [Candidatus Dojkabacteria bacterium]